MAESSAAEAVIARVTDTNLSVENRIAILERLSDDDTPSVVRALIRVAQDPDLPEALASAAGASLARICFRRSQDVDELEMADFTGAAYMAYDAEIARLLRASPDAKMRRRRAG
jgi:hypothetical protein